MSILKASAGLTLLAIAVRVMGLLRDLVLVWLFGATAETDAFYAVSSIVNAFHVVVSVSLASVVIPFMGEREHAARWQERARSLSTAFNVVVLLLALLALLLALAPSAVSRLISGHAPPEYLAVIDRFLVPAAPAIIFLGAAGIFSGMLNSARIFMPVAVAPALLNLCVILGVLVLGGRLGVLSAVVGLMIGAVAFLLIQIPRLHGIRYRHARGLLPDRETLAGFFCPSVPILVSAAMLYSYGFIDIFISSGLGAGVLTATNIATKLVQVPQGVIATGIATVTFPILAGLIEAGRRRDAGDLAMRVTLAITTLAAPVTILLGLTADLSVSLLFGHGTLSKEAEALAAELLAVMAFSLPALSANLFLVRVLYSLKNWTFAAFSMLVGLVLKLGIGLLGLPAFGKDAISISTVVAFGVTTLVMLLRINRALPGAFSGAFLRRLLRILAGALLSGACVYLAKRELVELLGLRATILLIPLLALVLAGVTLLLMRSLLRAEMQNIRALRQR